MKTSIYFVGIIFIIAVAVSCAGDIDIINSKGTGVSWDCVITVSDKDGEDEFSTTIEAGSTNVYSVKVFGENPFTLSITPKKVYDIWGNEVQDSSSWDFGEFPTNYQSTHYDTMLKCYETLSNLEGEYTFVGWYYILDIGLTPTNTNLPYGDGHIGVYPR